MDAPPGPDCVVRVGGPARAYGLRESERLSPAAALTWGMLRPWEKLRGSKWLAVARSKSVRHVAISGVARAGSGWLAPFPGKLASEMKWRLVGI